MVLGAVDPDADGGAGTAQGGDELESLDITLGRNSDAVEEVKLEQSKYEDGSLITVDVEGRSFVRFCVDEQAVECFTHLLSAMCEQYRDKKLKVVAAESECGGKFFRDGGMVYGDCVHGFRFGYKKKGNIKDLEKGIVCAEYTLMGTTKQQFLAAVCRFGLLGIWEGDKFVVMSSSSDGKVSDRRSGGSLIYSCSCVKEVVRLFCAPALPERGCIGTVYGQPRRRMKVWALLIGFAIALLQGGIELGRAFIGMRN